MIYKASGVLALAFAVATAVGAYSAPAAAQLQLPQACGGNLVACANVARQAQALQALAETPAAAPC